MYLLLAFAYRWIVWDIPPLIRFPTIRSITTSVNNSNTTSAFLRRACHTSPGAVKK